jgi:hypothetical protein
MQCVSGVRTRRQSSQFRLPTSGKADVGERVVGRQVSKKGRPLTKFVGHDGGKSLWCRAVHTSSLRRTHGRGSIPNSLSSVGSFKKIVEGLTQAGRGERKGW